MRRTLCMRTNRQASGPGSRQWIRTAAITVALLISTLISAAAPPDSNKAARDLRDLPPGTTADVIIQFRNVPSEGDIAELQNLGAKVKGRFKYLRAGLFSLKASSLASLAASPGGVYISPDRKVGGSLEFAEPTVGGDVAYQNGWTGAGVGVA